MQCFKLVSYVVTCCVDSPWLFQQHVMLWLCWFSTYTVQHVEFQLAGYRVFFLLGYTGMQTFLAPILGWMILVKIPSSSGKHWGILPFQLPSLWQILMASFPSFRTKPSLQMQTALEPVVVPLQQTTPSVIEELFTSSLSVHLLGFGVPL